MSAKNIDTNEKTIDALKREITDLKTSNATLIEKVNELEAKTSEENISEKKKGNIDIRAVMLLLSLIGLIATTVYLMYKG